MPSALASDGSEFPLASWMADQPQVTRFIEQPSPPDEQVPCNKCEKPLQRAFYSAKQWNSRKRERGITCRDCSSRIHRDLDAAQAMTVAAMSNRLASGVHIKPRNHGYCDYIDQLFRHDCYSTLVQLKLFPSAKDCSESMGALQGVGAFAESTAGSRANAQRGVLVLAIGDGTTPRTAALACFLTSWHAVSIDPLLDSKWVGTNPNGVRQLTGHRGTLDEYMQRLPALTTRTEDGEPLVKLVLLCVHSHARFIGDSCISAIRAKYGHVATTLVAIPCCATFHPEKDIGRRAEISYEDLCIFSDKRKVSVWNWGRGVEGGCMRGGRWEVAHDDEAMGACEQCT
jgi:DNA-directed RNA polymerase subunit RPC12/RpoP